MSFDNKGDRLVEMLTVLQHRTKYLNGTPIIIGGETDESRVKLSLINVAFLNQKYNDTLEFTVGDKYTIWPGIYTHLSHCNLGVIFTYAKVLSLTMAHQEKN